MCFRMSGSFVAIPGVQMGDYSASATRTASARHIVLMKNAVIRIIAMPSVSQASHFPWRCHRLFMNRSPLPLVRGV